MRTRNWTTVAIASCALLLPLRARAMQKEDDLCLKEDVNLVAPLEDADVILEKTGEEVKSDFKSSFKGTAKLFLNLYSQEELWNVGFPEFAIGFNGFSKLEKEEREFVEKTVQDEYENKFLRALEDIGTKRHSEIRRLGHEELQSKLKTVGEEIIVDIQKRFENWHPLLQYKSEIQERVSERRKAMAIGIGSLVLSIAGVVVSAIASPPSGGLTGFTLALACYGVVRTALPLAVQIGNSVWSSKKLRERAQTCVNNIAEQITGKGDYQPNDVKEGIFGVVKGLTGLTVLFDSSLRACRERIETAITVVGGRALRTLKKDPKLQKSEIAQKLRTQYGQFRELLVMKKKMAVLALLFQRNAKVGTWVPRVTQVVVAMVLAGFSTFGTLDLGNTLREANEVTKHALILAGIVLSSTDNGNTAVQEIVEDCRQVAGTSKTSQRAQALNTQYVKLKDKYQSIFSESNYENFAQRFKSEVDGKLFSELDDL